MPDRDSTPPERIVVRRNGQLIIGQIIGQQRGTVRPVSVMRNIAHNFQIRRDRSQGDENLRTQSTATSGLPRGDEAVLDNESESYVLAKFVIGLIAECPD